MSLVFSSVFYSHVHHSKIIRITLYMVVTTVVLNALFSHLYFVLKFSVSNTKILCNLGCRGLTKCINSFNLFLSTNLHFVSIFITLSNRLFP